MATKSPSAGEFAFLTAKQKATLDLLANHRTSKEIAHALSLSETSVNRRIEAVRLRLGGITRQELARRYNQWLAAHGAANIATAAKPAENSQSPCVESGVDNLQLVQMPGAGERPDRDSEVRTTAFEDPIAMSIEAPWRVYSEPRIVPRVLDGDNARLTRGAAIAVLVLAIVASIVVALAAAKALADAVG